MMVKEGYEYTLSIPSTLSSVPEFLRKLIKQAGLSVLEFNGL